MSSSDNAAIPGPTSASESQPAKSSPNTAAIAGAVGGGIVLALMLTLVMYIVIRRRFREARSLFVDGHEGAGEGTGEGNSGPDNDCASMATRRASEEDMPSPNYRRLFPYDSGSVVEQAHAAHGDRVYPAGVSISAQAAPIRLLPSVPSLAGSAFNRDREHALRPRATLDSSVLAWMGVIPSPREVTVLSGEKGTEGKGALEKEG
jgi:hypothetical protein